MTSSSPTTTPHPRRSSLSTAERTSCGPPTASSGVGCAMNMMTEMLWGGTVAKHVEIEFTKAVAELLDVVGAPNLSEFFPMLSWLDLQGLVKQARKVSAWINRILDGIVEERRRMVNPRKDFLQVLLDISQNTDPEEPMTDDVVKALLLVS